MKEFSQSKMPKCLPSNLTNISTADERILRVRKQAFQYKGMSSLIKKKKLDSSYTLSSDLKKPRYLHGTFLTYFNSFRM